MTRSAKIVFFLIVGLSVICSIGILLLQNLDFLGLG
jgi:hypothetical protein